MTGHVRADARKRGMHEHDGAPCWSRECAPVAPTGLPGYTVANDYAGDPHVWRDDNGRRVPVLSRHHCADARLWEFIVAGIGGRA